MVYVFRPENLTVSYTADQKGCRGLEEEVQKLKAVLCTKEIMPGSFAPVLEVKNEGFQTSGQVQYVATGNLVVAAISRQNADKAPVPSFMLKDSPCFIGLKKNEPALKAKVDALIEQGIKDGTLNGLSEQWLKAPLPASLGA